MKRVAVLVALLATAACGGVPVASSSPKPSPAPLVSPSRSLSPGPAGLLFAVLEKGSASQANTVAIVGLDGFARAKEHFSPRSVPALCRAALITQPEARVANGEVFYADGTGQVRSLSAGGRLADVTQFAVTSQQALSFAVDPSGMQILGSVLTIPKGDCANQSGSYVVDLESATAGGHPQNVYHQAYAQLSSSANVVAAVGWDPAGALVTVHTEVGTQASPSGRQWWGELAHWSPQGIGATLGGADCEADDEGANSIACLNGIIRSPDGAKQWAVSEQAIQIRLSPDGNQAAWCGSGACYVSGRDGSSVKLATFVPTGWLDCSTLIGTKGATVTDGYGDLETISLGDPTKVNDLGFMGSFVGVVQGS